MKGRHISRSAQRRLRGQKKAYRELSIAELIKLADGGDWAAMLELRRLCGYSAG